MKVFFICVLAFSNLLAEDTFKPLLIGGNLEGWEIDTPGLWEVRDGMIVGKSPGLKYNDFLRTKKSYSNFIHKLSFRLVAGRGNSGIQFRSRPVPGSHEVSGYQADINANRDCWGCLYDESRRNRVLAQATAESLTSLRRDDWNELVISARGNHITIDLNGVRAVDYHEQESGIEEAGFIALQLHSGPAMEIHFKDLKICELIQ